MILGEDSRNLGQLFDDREDDAIIAVALETGQGTMRSLRSLRSWGTPGGDDRIQVGVP
ncbi:MAG: hypothetical protein ACE5JI_17545 [Acidobacteriota bacterium]